VKLDFERDFYEKYIRVWDGIDYCIVRQIVKYYFPILMDMSNLIREDKGLSNLKLDFSGWRWILEHVFCKKMSNKKVENLVRGLIYHYLIKEGILRFNLI